MGRSNLRVALLSPLHPCSKHLPVIEFQPDGITIGAAGSSNLAVANALRISIQPRHPLFFWRQVLDPDAEQLQQSGGVGALERFQ